MKGGETEVLKYPELAMTYDEMFNTKPLWDVLPEFVHGIRDYCKGAGFEISDTEAAELFIPECLQRLYMEWHGFGEYTRDSFMLGMLNGWLNEWRDLVENGKAPDGLLEDGKECTINYVRRMARNAFIRVRNHDDKGSTDEFKKLVCSEVRSWVAEQIRKREARNSHAAKLRKTRLVRLRLTDIEYILNRIDECVEPDGEPGFRSRVRACLLGSKEAALEGLDETKEDK